MEISERCKKQIENIERLANEFKVLDEKEPHSVVMWDRDFEAIIELYIAYNSTIKQLEDITELFHQANEYINDSEEIEDRCNTLEAENEKLKKSFTEHLNALEAENEKLKEEIVEYKYSLELKTKTIEHLTECFNKQVKKIQELKDAKHQLHTIKKSFEVLRSLYLGDYDYDDTEPF